VIWPVFTGGLRDRNVLGLKGGQLDIALNASFFGTYPLRRDGWAFAAEIADATSAAR